MNLISIMKQSFGINGRLTKHCNIAMWRREEEHIWLKFKNMAISTAFYHDNFVVL